MLVLNSECPRLANPCSPTCRLARDHTMQAQPGRKRAEVFQRLHTGSEILILPGVWDVASARIFAAQKFPALGTTSSGIAWSLGYALGPDIEWPVFLNVCRQIAQAVDVPVSFDIEAGFGDTPQVVSQHVREAIDSGASGINIEDGFRDGRFVPADEHADKIRAIREVCAGIDYPLYINARTDVYLGGVADKASQLGEAIVRAQRYVDAGADGIFVPGLSDSGEIATFVQEVPRPVNVYALPGVPGSEQLRGLGVRRVSLGAGPLQAVLARTDQIARSVRKDGDWTSFTESWLVYEEAIRVCTEVVPHQ